VGVFAGRLVGVSVGICVGELVGATSLACTGSGEADKVKAPVSYKLVGPAMRSSKRE
jgi:hypothetical protein